MKIKNKNSLFTLQLLFATHFDWVFDGQSGGENSLHFTHSSVVLPPKKLHHSDLYTQKKWRKTKNKKNTPYALHSRHESYSVYLVCLQSFSVYGRSIPTPFTISDSIFSSPLGKIIAFLLLFTVTFFLSHRCEMRLMCAVTKENRHLLFILSTLNVNF